MKSERQMISSWKYKNRESVTKDVIVALPPLGTLDWIWLHLCLCLYRRLCRRRRRRFDRRHSAERSVF